MTTPASFPGSARIRRVEGVEESPVGDRLVLYHSGTGAAITLNPTGAALWRRLEVPSSFDALVGWLEETGEPEAGRARRDLEAFLHDLSEHELIEIDE